MASSSKNVKLGSCTVFFDGMDLGYTKGGVTVEVATTTHEVKVDQTGETPLKEIVTGRTVTAKVPLAETTLENMVATMPGSTIITDGRKAAGKIAFTAVPTADDTITIDDVTFTFKAAAVAPTDIVIPATTAATALAVAVAVQLLVTTVRAKASGTEVILTANDYGVAGNSIALAKTGAGATTTAFAGGVAMTKAKVAVPSGVDIDLLDVAKTLVLRPKGTTGSDDFIILRAACPGALNFSYTHDNERVYQADFKGYITESGQLFEVGDQTATS